jgi:hypothetical protein
VRREHQDTRVPARSRPTLGRAAAAARLVGAEAGEDAVAERMRHAARRARTTGLASGVVSSASAVAAPMVSGASALAVAPLSRHHARPDQRPRPEEARPRHLRLVPEGLSPAQRRRRARALVMATVGAAAMIGLALVYFHVVLAQRQFALDHLQSQVQKAEASYQQQRLEVAHLGSPGQIIARAEGQLGMIQPASVAYLAPPSGSNARAVAGTSKEPLGQIGRTDVTPADAPAGDAAWPTIKQQLAGIP